jgi:8-oxo-dGTP diphosphatase
MGTEERPKIGVGLLVVKNNHVLLGKRRANHGDGEYSGPGGHFEHLESIEGAMLRELAEKAGPQLRVKILVCLRLAT